MQPEHLHPQVPIRYLQLIITIAADPGLPWPAAPSGFHAQGQDPGLRPTEMQQNQGEAGPEMAVLQAVAPGGGWSMVPGMKGPPWLQEPGLQPEKPHVPTSAKWDKTSGPAPNNPTTSNSRALPSSRLAEPPMAQPILTPLPPARGVLGRPARCGYPCAQGDVARGPQRCTNKHLCTSAESSREQARAGASRGTCLGDAAPGDLAEGFSLGPPAGEACARGSAASVLAFT